MMTRQEIFDALDVVGATIHDAAWLTDDAVERSFCAWVAAGKPLNATIRVENRDGREAIEVEVTHHPSRDEREYEKSWQGVGPDPKGPTCVQCEKPYDHGCNSDFCSQACEDAYIAEHAPKSEPVVQPSVREFLDQPRVLRCASPACGADFWTAMVVQPCIKCGGPTRDETPADRAKVTNKHKAGQMALF